MSEIFSCNLLMLFKEYPTSICSDIIGLQSIQTELAGLIGEQEDDVHLIGENHIYNTQVCHLGVLNFG